MLPLFRSQSLVHTLLFSFVVSVAATAAAESNCNSSLVSVNAIFSLHGVSARLRAAFWQNSIVCGRFRRPPCHLRSDGLKTAWACMGPLSQGLSPQKCPSEDWHFCLWRVLEHLASTIFCRRPTHLQPDYSLARENLPQRQAFSRETQLDPNSLLYRLMKQPEVSSLNSMCDIWMTLPSETPPERVHEDLVVFLERLRVIGLESNVSKCGTRPVDIQGIPGTINEKREALERMTSKLEVLNPHQSFVLLKNAFAIPKLQYVLRVLLV